MRLKKLHILVLKSFFPIFIATFFVSIFVLILQFLWLYVDDLIGKGLEAWVIFKLLFYASIEMIPLAMPIAVMLSSIMTFGNMGENYELTAIKAAGISVLRVFRPLIIVSALIAVFNYYLSDKIVPVASIKLETMLFDIRQRHPALNIQPGIFNYDIDGYVIRISHKNPNTDMMYDFLVYDHLNARANNRVIAADSGLIQMTRDYSYLILTLYHGCQYEEEPEKEMDFSKRHFPYREDYFDKYRVVIKLQGFKLQQTDYHIFGSSYQMLTSRQLRERIDSLLMQYHAREHFYVNLLLNNYMFLRGIKMYDRRDTFQYYNSLKIWRRLDPKKMPVILNLDKAYQKMSLNNKSDVMAIALGYASRVYSQLNVAEIDLKTKKIWIAKHEIAYYRKLTFAVACLLFFFIGAPLGAIIRKGGFGFPVIVSIILYLIYYIISISSENLILQGSLNPAIGMWIATVIFVPIGIFLVYRVSTDRVVTNFDYIVQNTLLVFKRIFRFLRKRVR